MEESKQRRIEETGKHWREIRSVHKEQQHQAQAKILEMIKASGIDPVIGLQKADPRFREVLNLILVGYKRGITVEAFLKQIETMVNPNGTE